MTAKTFGRRGVAPQVTAPLPRVRAATAVPDVEVDQDPAPFRSRRRSARESDRGYPVPDRRHDFVSAARFRCGKASGVRHWQEWRPSVELLIAFGAVSYDRWSWRENGGGSASRPCCTQAYSHLLGNCFALFFVGMRLEPMIGRAWFLTIFIVGALGGVAGSLIGNPPGVPSAARRGHYRAIGAFSRELPSRDPVEQRAMRERDVVRLPALLPSCIAATGDVDYAAHAGGATPECVDWP